MMMIWNHLKSEIKMMKYQSNNPRNVEKAMKMSLSNRKKTSDVDEEHRDESETFEHKIDELFSECSQITGCRDRAGLCGIPH